MGEEQEVKVGDYIAITISPSGSSHIIGFSKTVDEAHNLVTKELEASIMNDISNGEKQPKKLRWIIAKVSSRYHTEGVHSYG
jgi:hypothetical protein